MSRDSNLYLEDLVECCLKVHRYTQGLTQEKFLEDEIIYDAVLRNLELIGEIVRILPEDIRILRPEIPWRKIAETRNIIAHVYFGIDNDIIWDIITLKIPELLVAIKQILATRMDR